MDTNPAAASRNLHHTLEYRDEQDWFDENSPRGLGDGDWYELPEWYGQPR